MASQELASIFVTDTFFSAGKDATEAFFALHRREILERPQYAKLRIGVTEGWIEPKQAISDGLSDVPYAEPTWLMKGFHSPYYSEVSQ